MDSNAANPLHVSSLINKMNSYDKDFRFMAINDLISELQNDAVRLDSDSERKLTNEVLRLLEDQNLEVQNQAVKCLSHLIRKIKDPNVVNIIRDLTNKMMQGNNENICGISAIGLKTIITDTTINETSVCEILISEIPRPLIVLMNQNETSGVRLMEAFDIMSEVLNKFGMKLSQDTMKSIFASCKQQIFNDRISVRKRAIACIGSFLSVTGPEYFDDFLTFLLQKLSNCTKKNYQDNMKTLIQCIAALTKQPNRASVNISKIYPTLINLLKNNNDEIQDLVLQTFETLIGKCSTEMFVYFNDILTILLTSIAYDPNYHYDEEDNNGMDYECEGDDDEEENDELLYSDDDDLSWKVRRSAIKCLETFITTYPNMIHEFVRIVGPVLVDRFKEREETVKKEIFQCTLTLLKQISGSMKLYRHRPSSEINQFNKQVSNLILSMLEKLKKQSKSKNWIIRQGMFSLLQEATTALPNCFSKSIGTVINIAMMTLLERMSNANLKFDAMHFLVELLNSHQDVMFSEYFSDLTKILTVFLNDSFYRLSLESLDLSLILISRAKQQNHVNTILQIYPQLFILLKTPNADFEIKEKSINTMCCLLCHLGNYLQPAQIEESLRVLMERLNNELVRITIIRAFTSICKVSTVVNLQNYVPKIVSTVTQFLVKNDRTLRSETLHCLEAIWTNYDKMLVQHSQLMIDIIPMLPPLLSDSDLQIAQNSISICTIFLTTNNQDMKVPFWNLLMPPILDLLKSPLLHGTTLQSLINLMATISKEDVFDFKEVTTKILNTIVTSPSIDCINREVYPHVACCIAELVVNSKNCDKIDQYIQEFYRSSMIKGKSDRSSHQYLSIMILGEIGRYVDMSQRNYVLENIMQIFDYGHELLKSAAAYSLGKMAQSKLDVFIPYILNNMKQNPDYQYFLLHSLREVILNITNNNSSNWSKLSGYSQTIWNLLIENAQSSEEGVRNIVSECLGKMVLMDPHVLMPKLKDILLNGNINNAMCRATIVTAIKYTIVSENHQVDNYLQNGHITEFLYCLKDPDLSVQRAGLITLNTIIHIKPSLIRDSLNNMSTSSTGGDSIQSDNLLAWLYDATKIRPELIREVEMGPFKHLEDDGLDLRKCAFECISNLLDYCIEDINILVFMDRIEEGLKDNGEIKLLCYPMLANISKNYPNKFLERLPSILPTIRNLLNSRSKQDAVKQEQEKLDEQKRAAVKFLVLVSANETFSKSTFLHEFLNSVINGPLKNMFLVEQEMVQQKQKY